MSTSTFKVGDRVRRKAEAPSGAYRVGHNAFVVTNIRDCDGSVWDDKGDLHHAYNVELVEPAAVTFKVGDRVRLTGTGWHGRAGAPLAGTIQTISRVGGYFPQFQVDGRACECVGKGHHSYGQYGADLVVVDSTGYPEGTPRAEKAIPETQDIKQEYAGRDSEALAEFNRWYEQELAEARAEGYQAGYEKGADDGLSEGYFNGLQAAAQGIVNNLLKGVPGV